MKEGKGKINLFMFIFDPLDKISNKSISFILCGIIYVSCTLLTFYWAENLFYSFCFMGHSSQ